MSRHGYVDDLDTLEFGRWRGRVASAIRGKRGQKLLRELRDALDAMPEKRLVARELVTVEGEYCALGCVGAARGVNLKELDPDCPEQVASAFDIAEVLVREITHENDEFRDWRNGRITDDGERRWEYMRKWVERRIVKTEEEKAAQ